MKEAIILMGLPLAGKTVWLDENNIGSTHKIVSADNIKETLKGYSPEEASLVHEESVQKARLEVFKLAETGENIAMDGGGINNSYTVGIINNLQARDYRVKLVHIKTPLNVCLDRMKSRKRKVPIEVMRDKSVVEDKQFHRLSKIVDEVEVVDYFTYKHIFIDMDGVLATYRVLQKFDGKVDFVNNEKFRHLEPVKVIIDKFKELAAKKGKELYILSAIPTNISMNEKNDWLDEHFPIDPKRRWYPNAAKHKPEMLEGLRKMYKLEKKDVVLVDDTHDTLYAVESLGMRSMHISEFLTFNFD